MTESKPVDWDELYPGRFIKAGLIGDGNARLTVTIGGIHTEELTTEQGTRVKGVLSFSDDKYQLPLNKTNGICMREMFGRKVQEWVGKRITLFSDTWNGEPCVRIWGSPDIAADMQVVVALPRRKPFTKTMHRVGAPSKAAKPAKPSEPPPPKASTSAPDAQSVAVTSKSAAASPDAVSAVPAAKFLDLLDWIKKAADIEQLEDIGGDIKLAKEAREVNEAQLKDLRLAYARRQAALELPAS
jgi:hypothetical protein